MNILIISRSAHRCHVTYSFVVYFNLSILGTVTWHTLFYLIPQFMADLPISRIKILLRVPKEIICQKFERNARRRYHAFIDFLHLSETTSNSYKFALTSYQSSQRSRDFRANNRLRYGIIFIFDEWQRNLDNRS